MSQAAPDKLDVYASSYVPQWLTAVNSAPALVSVTASTNGISVDAGAYKFDLYSSTSLQRPHVEQLAIYATRQTGGLAEGTYAEYFDTAIALECRALRDELWRYNLYSVPVKISNVDEHGYSCSVVVPGLREDTPQVLVGDLISLRQTLPDMGMPMHGVQYDSMVTAISRAKEQLSFMISGLQPATLRFNISFALQPSRIEPMRLAVAFLQTGLRDPESAAQNAHEISGIEAERAVVDQPRCGQLWLRCMLFPGEEDSDLQKTLNRIDFGGEWYDGALNYEQRRAVQSVRDRNYGQLPYLISGPPGTGKTKTLVEIALQLSDIGTSSLIVCAPSDSAADTLLRRLTDCPHNELLRLVSPARSFAEVPGDVIPYCHILNESFALPPFKRLMRYKIVVTACRDANMLIQAGVTNQDLFALEHSISAAIHPDDRQRKYKLHWQGLLIDEAAQAIEPEVAIPLAVVAPPRETHLLVSTPCFIMAGDTQQLGPRTSSQLPEIAQSLFGRLFDRAVYADHPLARSRFSGKPSRSILTQEMLPLRRPAFATLVRNYRSHPAVLAVPSRLFYHDTLIPEATAIDGLAHWQGWQGRKWPVLFASHKGDDELEADGGGWYNISEAEQACDYASSLLRSGLILQKDICIISPFRAQVQRLRKMARSNKYKMWDVNIGPLEAFQGLESRAVILCTTRSRARFLDEDRQRGWGIVHDSKKFNVAMTRAKEGLIVLGSEDVLSTNYNWRAFLGLCDRHGLRAELVADTKGKRDGPISVLETALLLEAGQDSGKYVGLSLAADLDEEMMLSGIAAEMQLNDIEEEKEGEIFSKN